MWASDYTLIEIKLKFKKWHGPAVFGMVVVALSGYWLMQEWLGPRVDGYSVVKEELVQTVVASGKVALSPGIEISSKVNGRVAEVKVAQGESVSAGQVLLALENKVDRGASERARAATAQAEARFRKISEQTQAGSEQSLSRAKAALDQAKKQYTRAGELAAKGLVSPEQSADALRNLTIAQRQLSNAQFQAKAMRAKGSDYALAEIALNKARASERAVREKSGNRVIKAETAGVLTACMVTRGDAVVPGKTLLVISPASATRLLVQTDEKNIRDLKFGQTASVAVEGHPEQRFSAALRSINSAADNTGAVAELGFNTVNPPDHLSAGMGVTLAIEVARRDHALSVPAKAIRNAGGGEPWVMVVDNGRAYRRAVKLGVRSQHKVEILEGLREGDFVLAATGAEVEEGKRIRLAKAG